MDAPGNFPPPPDYKAPPPPVPSKVGRGVLPSRQRELRSKGSDKRRPIQFLGSPINFSPGRVDAQVSREKLAPSMGATWTEAIKNMGTGVQQLVNRTKMSVQLSDSPKIKDFQSKIDAFKQGAAEWTQDIDKRLDSIKKGETDKIGKHTEFFHASKEILETLFQAQKDFKNSLANVKAGPFSGKQKKALEENVGRLKEASDFEKKVDELRVALSEFYDNQVVDLSPEEAKESLQKNQQLANESPIDKKTWTTVNFQAASDQIPDVEPEITGQQKKPSDDAEAVDGAGKASNELEIKQQVAEKLANLSRANNTIPPTTDTVNRNGHSMSLGVASVQNVMKYESNEDRIVYQTLRVGNREIPYMSVIDGHNGSNVAEDLKQHFPSFLEEALRQLPALDDASISNCLNRACIEYNTQLREKNLDKGGACASMALIIDDALWVANVGDTRIALIEPNGCRNLSEDKDLSNPLHKAEAEALGAKLNPRGDRIMKVGDGSGGLQCPGSFGDKNFAGTSAHPFVNKVDLRECAPGSYIVMGCDGLWDSATTEEVAEEVRNGRNLSPGEIAGRLAWKTANANEARNVVDKKGGAAGDDISVLVMQVR